MDADITIANISSLVNLQKMGFGDSSTCTLYDSNCDLLPELPNTSVKGITAGVGK